MYSATYLTSFIISNNLGKIPQDYAYDYIICKCRYFDFFSIQVIPPLLTYLLMARTSTKMMTRIQENKHVCIIPDFRGKAFRLLLASMMLFVGFFLFLIYFPKQFEEIIFYSQFVGVSIMKSRQIQSNAVSASIERIMWFGLYSFNIVCYIILFVSVEMNSHPQDKSHLLMLYNSFYV